MSPPLSGRGPVQRMPFLNVQMPNVYSEANAFHDRPPAAAPPCAACGYTRQAFNLRGQAGCLRCGQPSPLPKDAAP